MEKDIFNIFDSEQDFWNIKRDPGYEKSTISVVDGSETHIGELLFFGNESAQAGDILVVDKNGKKMYTDPVSYRTLKEDGEIGDNGYTPIGVCAIPVGLTVNLGNQGVNKGKSRVVSLANMSLKTPDTGSLKPNGIAEDNLMYWGEMGTHLSGFNAGDERYRPAWIDLKTGVITENSEIQSVYLPSTAAELEVLSNKRYVDKSDPKLPKYFFSEFDQLRSDAAAGVSPYGRYGKYYFKGYLGILMGKEITDTIISKVTAEWGEGCN